MVRFFGEPNRTKDQSPLGHQFGMVQLQTLDELPAKLGFFGNYPFVIYV
jgi:hypothetical protein